MNMHAGPPFMIPWFLIALIGIAVVAGIVYTIRALGNGSGQRVAWTLAGVIVVGLLMALVSFRTSHEIMPPRMASQQHGFSPNSGQHGFSHELHETPPKVVVTPTIDLSHESGDKPPVKSTTILAPETTTFTPDALEAKSNNKPAWLTQGTQTGNGVSQFPVSSELFATVAECQKDLDSRMPGLIANEVRYLVGEEFPIALSHGEEQGLTAETFTEEVPTSQGTWYKIHRLVKIDQPTWAMFRSRFHQAQLHARLESLGLGFGGLMLALGVGYLILRRTPRVVDPTLETFSTT